MKIEDQLKKIAEEIPQADWDRVNDNKFTVGNLLVNDEILVASLNGKSHVLSATEFRILRYFSRRLGQVVTRSEINGLLLRNSKSPRSADVHMYRLRKYFPDWNVRTIRLRGWAIEG